MTEYLVFVVTASAVVTFGAFMLYGGKKSKTSRAALGIILLSSVVIPLVSAVGSIGDISAEDIIGAYGDGDVDDGTYEKRAEEAFCEGICKMICEEHSLARDDVSVSCFGFVLTEMRAEKIKVILSGGAVHANARAIAARIREAGLGECEVELEFSG